ncbi:MAG: hypothetical protein MI725_03925, partial [Pirellulales bacterium]|nr:hypothetical protein [Pirellulales bacterium]
LPMQTVASHGDFVNRKLGLCNWEITKDRELRAELKIELEAYDEHGAPIIQARCSDAPYPQFWTPENPIAAIQQRLSCVYLLVHPRHWRANRAVNLGDTIVRAWQGLHYSVNSKVRRRAA